VSISALVQHVGEVLGRAHALFGDPPDSGGSAAAGAGAKLAGARDELRSGQARISGLSGRLATNYGEFAAGAGAALDGLAGTDERLTGQIGEAASADRAGRAASGAVVTGAQADTAGLAPFSNTPAGQKALVSALRSRVVQQQKVVAAYRARDARLAALLRSIAYTGRPGGGGIPLGTGGFGGGSPAGQLGGIPSSLPGLSALSAFTHFGHNPRTALAAQVYDRRGAAVPAGPGRIAAHAALSRQGAPYLWGAKGPNRFPANLRAPRKSLRALGPAALRQRSAGRGLACSGPPAIIGGPEGKKALGLWGPASSGAAGRFRFR
jgi:peptidoglycan DL-endopeptidase CwlO